MSVTSTVNRFTFTGDGVVVAFPMTNCLVYASTHVEVYLAGVLQGAGYTVSGLSDAAGATVTFAVAPGSGVAVLLLRVVPLTQTTTYAVAGAFPAKTNEKDHDLGTMQTQQLDEVDDRAIQWPKTVTTSPSNVLPDPSVAANQSKVLRIASNGLSLEAIAASDAAFTSPLTTKGDLVVHNGTGAVRLPVGTNGQILEADSTDAEGVVWAAAPIKPTIVDAKGDILVGTAADTLVRKAVGANGTVVMARSATTDGLAYVAALNKAIYGLTYANNGVDATNDLDIAAGGAMDATGAYFMVGSALTKQSDVAWAVGNNAGMLDTGAVGNSDYYIWEIVRSDTGVVDYLSSLSSTTPTMPTSYDFKRLIGWFKRVAGTIVAFDTYETGGGGLEFIWDSPTLDIDLIDTLTTARRTDAVKVPRNFSVLAKLWVRISDNVTFSDNLVYCPDQADLVPSPSAAPLGNVHTSTAQEGVAELHVRTSATGTIAARSTLATVDSYRVATLGFIWARRN